MNIYVFGLCGQDKVGVGWGVVDLDGVGFVDVVFVVDMGVG